jgi:hypothetical protein
MPNTRVAHPVVQVEAWIKFYNANPNGAVKQATFAFPEFGKVIGIKLRRMPAEAAFAETIRRIAVKQ